MKREREAERDTERETDRERDKERHTERQRERERERETFDDNNIQLMFSVSVCPKVITFYGFCMFD